MRIYEEIRDTHLSLTHSLITPHANRSAGPAQQADPVLAARVKAKTDSGFVVHGCRMLATLPIADALPRVTVDVAQGHGGRRALRVRLRDFDRRARALKLICRESLAEGRSRFDHPLGSPFEEMDAVVVFDDVHVPWDNVLPYPDVERCNVAHARTGAVAGMAHQVMVKNIAKSEFVLGLAALLVDTIGAKRFRHVKLAEL